MRKNSAGLGIIEVLVAATIGVMVMYGILSIVRVSTKQTRYAQTKIDFNSLAQSIDAALKNTAVCSTAMFDANGSTARFQPGLALSPATAVSEIRVGGQPLARIGLESNGFKIESLSLTDVAPTSRTVIAGGQTLYLTRFTLQGAPIGNPASMQLKWETLLHIVSRDSDGAITQCSSSAPPATGTPAPPPSTPSTPTTPEPPSEFPITVQYLCAQKGALSDGTPLYVLYTMTQSPQGASGAGNYAEELRLEHCEAQRSFLTSRRSQLPNNQTAYYMCACLGAYSGSYGTGTVARYYGSRMDSYNSVQSNNVWGDMGDCQSTMGACIAQAQSLMQ